VAVIDGKGVKIASDAQCKDTSSGSGTLTSQKIHFVTAPAGTGSLCPSLDDFNTALPAPGL
jgi:hypothetical protein